MPKTQTLKIPSDAFPELWYDIISLDHFWFDWRFRVLRAVLRTLDLPATGTVHALDIGSGSGLMINQLENVTDWTIDGCDLNPRFVNQIKCRGRYFQYDIYERKESMRGIYDIVFLFDILEHLENPGSFLECSAFYLKKGGKLIINVPAFQALFGSYDKVVGHKRRYTKRTLHEIIPAQFFDISDSRYWGMSISSLVAIRKILDRDDSDPEKIIRRGMATPPALINNVLKFLGVVESKLITHPPLGCSLMVTLCCK